MTRSLPFVLGLFIAASACAQDMDGMEAMPTRSIEEARVSPNARVGTTVGTTNVDVAYGRPSLRGRAYFADTTGLAPMGAVWRTGANEAPTFTTAADLMVEGAMLPAGTYGLFTVPGDDEWMVIFSTNARQWGSFRYDSAEDALRVMVEPMAGAPMMEQFEIRFEDVAQDEATMVLHWGTVGVPIVLAEAGGDMGEMEEDGMDMEDGM